MNKKERAVVRRFFRSLDAGRDVGHPAMLPQAVHRYQCPCTRHGRTVHGPCDCGGVSRQHEITSAMADLLKLIN